MINIERTFGDRLNEALVCRRMSQTELAKRVGTSKNNINLYINNKSQPGAKILARICEEVEVSSDWLLGI